MPPAGFRERLASALAPLLGPAERVCIGFSGGPDSSALLHGLLELRGPAALHIAHLNHRLRPEADEDEAFVRAEAARLGVPATIATAPIAEIADASGRGIEETGRDERIAFLSRTAAAAGCPAVVVGHTADDQAETVLHRIVRGTGLHGLAGIPASRPIAAGSAVRLIRPLLGFRKAELLEFLAGRGIRFRTDASNATAEFTRNRLRNQVLPLLTEINPQVVAALARLARIAGGADELVGRLAAVEVERCLRGRSADEVVLDAAALAGLPEIVRTEVIRRACLSLDPREDRWGFTAVTELAEYAAAPAGVGGAAISLPGGLRAQRDGNLVRIARPRTGEPAEPDDREQPLPVPGSAPAGTSGEVRAEILSGTAADLPALRGSGTECEVVDWDRVRPPLAVRGLRSGDRFHPLGAPGRKTVADFLADRKIGVGGRRRVVLVCDQAGPLWVCPHRIDERVRVGETTRSLLRLTLLET